MNEKLVFSYVLDRGKVGQKELIGRFVPKDMHKGALYRTLGRLSEQGKIVKLLILVGSRNRVYYEIPIVATIAKVRRAIQVYKRENNDSNPNLKEIAVEVGLPPEDISHAVYAVAKEVDWLPEGMEGKIKRYGAYEQPFNKKEVGLLLANMKDAHLQEVAAHHFQLISSRQELMNYPSLLSEIAEILESNPPDQSVNYIVNAIYYVCISHSFKEKKENRKYPKGISRILDWMYITLINQKYNREVRISSVRLFGLLNDKRAIDILISSLKKADTNGEYEYRPAYETWMFGRFYSEYRDELLERMFELSKENKAGALILSRLINQRLDY